MEFAENLESKLGLQARGGGPTDAAFDSPYPELSEEDEKLAEALNRALARLAGAVVSSTAAAAGEQGMRAALSGAAMTIRWELSEGDGRRILKVLPGLVFLVTLQSLEWAEALGLAERTTELLAHGED